MFMQHHFAKLREVVHHLPLSAQILGQFLIGSDVNASSFSVTSAGFLLLTEQPQDGEFRTDCFTRSSGGANEHVIVRVVQRVEHLRLDGVEL